MLSRHQLAVPALFLAGSLLLATLSSVDAFVAKTTQRPIVTGTPSSLFASTSSTTGTKKTFGENTFTDEELITMTQDYLDAPSPDFWSDDFVFRGPVIGPLVKQDLIDTLGQVGPQDAFEDFESNAFGFSVDPTEANRVWWFVRPRGVFANPYQHPVLGEIQPTGEKLVAPPEARSVVFNSAGKVKYQTVGYVTDRYTGDTTKGLGAVFGLMQHMGIDMDGSYGSPSMRFIQWLSSRVLPAGTLPKSYSSEEDLPAWWKDERRGADA